MGHAASVLIWALLVSFKAVLFATALPSPAKHAQVQHVQFIIAADDLVSESEKLNPFARAFARTLNAPWVVLGDTELLYDNDEPFWRTVFVQDVDLEEGREWAFEVYDKQGDEEILIGRAGPLPANYFLGENDDLLTIPIGSPGSGSLFLRNCRTFWNLCGLTSAANVRNTKL